jgi:hypothetical protein
VIDNVVRTDSWPSIAGVGCDLICVVQVKNKRERSMLVWPPRRQVGWVRGTQWPAGSSAGRTVGRKARCQPV